ncbi:MAG: helix-hairpin-helix domain-containing protein [Acidimicrobiales bacterium]
MSDESTAAGRGAAHKSSAKGSLSSDGNDKSTDAMQRLIAGRSTRSTVGANRTVLLVRDFLDFRKWSQGVRVVTAGLGVVLFALFAAIVFVQRTHAVEETPMPSPMSEVASPVTTSTTLAGIVVDVGGAVRSPGVYRLAQGARVVDALEKAGGPAEDSDLEQVNLAAMVADGQRVWISRRGEVGGGNLTDPSTGLAPGGMKTGPLDLNSATSQQLDALPGVGPATATAILNRRKELGRFRSVDDLLTVKGIGTAKLDALRGSVVVR